MVNHAILYSGCYGLSCILQQREAMSKVCCEKCKSIVPTNWQLQKTPGIKRSKAAFAKGFVEKAAPKWIYSHTTASQVRAISFEREYSLQGKPHNE